jgi:hypothetical protein
MKPDDRHLPEETPEELNLIRAALAADSPLDPCIEENELGQYLDGGPGSPEKRRLDIEGHLSRCTRCRARLIHLYREVETARDPAAKPRLGEAANAPGKVIENTNESTGQCSRRKTGKRSLTDLNHVADASEDPLFEKRK